MIWEITPGDPIRLHLLRWIAALAAGWILAWISGFALLLLFDTIWGARQLYYTYEFGSHRKLLTLMLGMIRDGGWIVLPLFTVAGIATGVAAGRVFTRALLFAGILSAIVFLALLLWLHFALLQSLVFVLALMAGLLCTWYMATGVNRD